MSYFSRLISLFKPYWHWIGIASLLALLTVLANIWLLTLSGWFISAMAIAGATGIMMNYFTPAGAIRGLALTRIAGRYGERIISHEATFRILAQLRIWFYQHIEPLAPAILEKYQSGDIFSRIRADIDALDQFYLRVFTPFLIAGITSTIVLIFIAFFNIWLALISLVLMSFTGIVLPLWLKQQGNQTGYAITQDNAKLRSYIIEQIQGLAELTIYQALKAHHAKIDHLENELSQNHHKMYYLESLSISIVSLSAYTTLFISLFMLIPMVSQEELASPIIAMLGLLILASFEVIQPLPTALQYLSKTYAAAERVFDIMDSQPLITEPKNSILLPEKYNIRFEKVSLCYDKDYVLKDISFTLNQGKHIAIVGSSGAGKSSLLKVLLRFWEYEGDVYLENKSLREYNSEHVRQIMGVVSQHSHLFNATILDNLRLANPQASLAEIEDAIEAAQLKDFIANQPQGLDTFVGETGSKVSGGQARRIDIARTLLKKAPILLLDEPTEGLDNYTAQRLMQTLYQVSQGKTMLLITHKLIHWQGIDEVIVLDKGRILEQGPPKTLLEQKGYFYQLQQRLELGQIV